MLEEEKFCRKGHSYKEHRVYKPGQYPFCRACKNLNSVARRKKNLAKFRAYDKLAQIKRYYGLNEKEYNNLVESANNKCMICGSPPGSKKLSVDHCHDTKKVRGLLCHYCNMAIGLFKDDIKLMKKAIKYLQTHK